MTFNLKKEKKVKPQSTNKTIEQLHDEKLQYLSRLQESVDRRQTFLRKKGTAKKVVCEECLDIVPSSKKECPVCSCKTLVEYSSSMESRMTEKIQDIQSKKEEIEYYLNSHSILLEYYTKPATQEDVSHSRLGTVKHTASNERQSIVQDYYRTNHQIYHQPVRKNFVEYCRDCHLELKETSEKDFLCTGCGVVVGRIIDGFSYNDAEHYDISGTFDYRRINYFTEWLNHIQAKEQITINEDLLNKIKTELRKERILDSSKVTQPKIKKILKLLGEPKLYDHIPAITSRICGIKPLRMPTEVIDKLKQLFMAIQAPFDLLKGPRKNFFSYPYVIYKFCELLGLHEYLSHFQLLKSREKLIKQDILWKSIIEHLQKHDTVVGIEWVFIASI